MDKPLLIVVGGPTASGKTALSLQLAKYFNTEILSADSRQCYREMNIGVAKPTPQEMQQVKHYFIHSHSIYDQVNAGTFEAYGLHVLKHIFATRKIAILVGGTGLYTNALLYGMDSIPAIPFEVRNDILKNFESHGLQWLQQAMQEKDPVLYSSIDEHNPHRLMRALEVVTHTGKSIATFRKTIPKARFFDTFKIAPQWERAVLYERIDKRVDQMMQDGLLQEAKILLPYQQLNALQTVGYKELFAYFNKEISLDNAVEAIKRNTRRYAKRQLTWFKKDTTYKWVAPHHSSTIIDEISAFYKGISK